MSDALFSLFVPGVPQPAGSKKAIPVFNRHTGKFVTTAKGRPIVNVVDDAKHSRAWKTRVGALARIHWTFQALDEPLALFVVFTMPRPQHHYGKRKGERYLKPNAPEWHTIAPDATKLLRAVEDALLQVVYVDDSRIVEQHVRKRYGDIAGVAIQVHRAAARDRLAV